MYNVCMCVYMYVCMYVCMHVCGDRTLFSSRVPACWMNWMGPTETQMVLQLPAIHTVQRMRQQTNTIDVQNNNVPPVYTYIHDHRYIPILYDATYIHSPILPSCHVRFTHEPFRSNYAGTPIISKFSA